MSIYRRNQYIERRTSCPICDSGDYDFLWHHSFAHMDEMEIVTAYDLCLCRGCGLLYANHIASQKDLDAYYFNYNRYESAVLQPWDEEHMPACDYILENIPGTGLVADFGCGQAYELRLLQNKGYTNLYALDTSTSNCAVLDTLGMHTLCKSVFDLKEEDFLQKLDAILVAGVLEHIVDLRGFLEKCKSVIKETGHLIIIVPSQQLELGVDKPFENFSIEHINYFTLKTLNRLLESCGFESVRTLANERLIIAAYMPLSKLTVRNYINDSLLAVELLLAKIDALIQDKSETVIWGTGALCRYLLVNTRFSELNIRAFVDSNRHYCGKRLSGIEIIMPEKLPIALQSMNEPTIIVVSYYSSPAILAHIRDNLNLFNEVICLL